MTQIATLDLPLEVDPALDENFVSENGGTSFQDPNIIQNIKSAGERTYQTHTKDAQYWLPNDSSEHDRLDYQHETVKMILDGRPGLAPLNYPKDILDIATGTGVWAHEIANQFPDAQVLGTDLSKVERKWPESNLSFVQHDAESDEWNFGRKFDYVHLRYVVSCFRDTNYNYIDSPPSAAMEEWLDITTGAISSIGGDMKKSARYRTWLEEVGFVNVVYKLFKSPANTWPKDPKLKQIGARQLVSITAAMESIDKLVAVAGIDPNVVQDLRPKAFADLRNTDYHAWMPIHIIYARKPVDG